MKPPYGKLRRWRTCLTTRWCLDGIGGAFRPKQPVARRFHLIRLEISDLAVDERLGDGRHKRQKLGVGDDGAAAQNGSLELKSSAPRRNCVRHDEP